MIGVANVRTEQLWKRLFVGYQADISSLLLFSYPLKLGNIAHHLTGVGLAQHLPSLKNYYKIVRSRNKGLSFFKINGFGEDYDEFFNQACTDYEIIPVRNSQYLNWRFRDCPTERYDIFLAKKVTEKQQIFHFETFVFRLLPALPNAPAFLSVPDIQFP